MIDIMVDPAIRIPAYITNDIVTDLESFRSISPEWEDLVSRSSGTIFQSFEWQRLWWKYFASDGCNRLLIVLVRDGRRLIGAAPFFLEDFSLARFKSVTQLKLIGSGLHLKKSALISLERDGPSDYLDILAAEGYERTVAASISNFLKDNSDLWDEIEFQNVPEDGVLMNHVVPQLQASGVTMTCKASDACPRIILPASTEEFRSSLEARTKRSLRRSEKTYLDNPDYSIDEVQDTPDLENGLQILSGLHQRRWNSAGYPGLFSDRRFSSMLHDLVQALAGSGKLWMEVMYHKDKPISARMGFVLNGRVYDYLSGVEHKTYESGPANYSGAGVATIQYAIDKSIHSGCQVFDLLRGDEAYKFTLNPSVYRNYSITMKSRRSTARKIMVQKIGSLQFSILSRIMCEWTIFNTIASERGRLLALPRFLMHLTNRITLRSLHHVNSRIAGQNLPTTSERPIGSSAMNKT